MSLDTVHITSKVLEYAPKEAGITRVEYEGPNIAIYSKNPVLLIHHGYLLTEIANKLKKRVIVRSEPQVRLSVDEAREKIGEILKSYVKTPDYFFDPVKGEVILYLIEPLDPSITPEVSFKIVSQTRWFPLFKRCLSPLSKTLAKVYSVNSYFEKERRGFYLSLGNRIFRIPMNPSRDIRVRVLGGAQEVGRSAFYFSTSETNLLIDFGIKPGVSNRVHAYPRIDLDDFNLDELDAVIITHAHLDHCGLLPFLYKHDYRGPVYVTEPTLPLMVLLQLDLIEIAKREGQTPPYTVADVQKMIYHCVTLKYGQVTDISPDVKLTFQNAGHVLGSAMVHLHVTEGVHNVVFTGDFKYGPTLLLDTAYSAFTRAETMIMESTYGGEDDVALPRREAEELLLSTINKSLRGGGKVLMPVPAVGRAQEVLVIFDRFLRAGQMPDVPIFVDGMLDESNAIHVSYTEYLSNSLRSLILNKGVNPFSAEQFVNVENSSQREEASRDGPCVIISTSGMMEGGPVLEYFKHLAGDEKNRLLFLSYQVSGTLGRRLLDGVRNVVMTEEDKMITVEVEAEVSKIEGFSGHSDRKQLLAYLKRVSPMVKNLYLAHGEPTKTSSLAQGARKLLRLNAKVLNNLQTVPLT
ncbi:MAG: beta-CASP ribonuclease aCPSF1 [Candidatus Geothermarchaeales archaeon]